ncbi:adaptin N terminal region-domain-containing protein [Polychytrium aggregatum]|uniref:adaptin N terminal region-domain-containing protein n=1 Tax=Polychytrium aggregatum TaxID=110093 RepID=UPI0022FE6303|nr:adaptin N terminal region-domain-containing protein [Polychytrium aggregatum]KAI9197460.1 adaptin N terminal region-domain-containing protein [Polychytrium aggregatum]
MDRYLSRAAHLAQEASKLSQKVTHQLVEKSKEVTIQGHLYDMTSEDKLAGIKPALDSKFDKEKIDALKKLIAMISKGKDVSEYFPDVVKNVASTSFEVRKLVYIYVLRYAEEQPDLALLSVNTFQKELSDRNPFIRAMSLRVLSSIRVPVIVPIVMLSLKKCTTDLSPYVRKTVANALLKCYSLDPTQKESIVEIIESLLNDVSTIVLGSVVASFSRICPERVDMIHKHYKKLCKMLPELDEWGQVEVLTLLLRYVRTHFPDPRAPSSSASDSKRPAKANFYSDDEEEQVHFQPAQSIVNPDHQLFINACKPLLGSRNPSVALMAVSVLHHVAPQSDMAKSAKTLIRLLSAAPEEQYVVLLHILTIAHKYPALFRPHLKSFFVFHGEPEYLKSIKLEILVILTDESNLSIVMREVKEYVNSTDLSLALATVKAISRLISRMPKASEACLKILIGVVPRKQADALVSESIIVIRQLLQLDTRSNDKTITYLSKSLEQIASPGARASILWLIGQYCETVPRIAPDTFRISAKRFADESEIAKLQILNLGAKLVVSTVQAADKAVSTVIKKIMEYVLTLARFDANYEIRDRARFLRSLLAGVMSEGDAVAGASEGAILGRKLREIILSTKAIPVTESPYLARGDRFQLGSLAFVLNHASKGYKELPQWSLTVEHAELRSVMDQEQVWNREHVVVSALIQQVKRMESNKTQKRVVNLSLDNFLDETESEDEEEGDDDEEEEEEEDDEDDDEDDEEEEVEDDEDEEEEDDGEDEGEEEVEEEDDGDEGEAEEEEEEDATAAPLLH